MVGARLFALDKKNLEVAEACGVSLAAVKIWKRAWRDQGAAGLAAKPHPGPPPLLSDHDLQRLEKMLLAGAHKAGFASDLWTCPRVAQLIAERLVWRTTRRTCGRFCASWAGPVRSLSGGRVSATRKPLSTGERSNGRG